MSKQVPSEDRISAVAEAALDAKRQVTLKKNELKLAKTVVKTADSRLKQARKELETAKQVAIAAKKKLRKSSKKDKKTKATAKDKVSASPVEPQAPVSETSTDEKHVAPGSESLVSH